MYTIYIIYIYIYIYIYINIIYIYIYSVFVKPANFKICDIISITAQCKLHLGLFLLNTKSYQNEIWSNTSVLHDKHFKHVFG